MVRVFLFTSLLAVGAFAQSSSPSPADIPVRLQYRDARLSDLVKFYQQLTKRKVWLDAELRFDQKMSLMSDGIIPGAEAIRLLRDALRKEGIEIREVGDSEAYVTRAAP